MESNYLKFNNGELEVCLDIVLFENDNKKIVYSPALDIMSYGDDDASAMNSFDVVFKETMFYMIKHNTLDSELRLLGWTKKKQMNDFFAPLFASYIDTKKELQDIVNSYSFQKISKSMILNCC